jgi:hypothetical protein
VRKHLCNSYMQGCLSIRSSFNGHSSISLFSSFILLTMINEALSSHAVKSLLNFFYV